MYSLEMLLADTSEDLEITHEQNKEGIQQLSAVGGAVRVRKKS